VTPSERVSDGSSTQKLALPGFIRVIDSHTEGEPTRVVIEGWPQPRGATMAARRDDMRARSDHLRRAVVCEPRGHDAIVGALLTPPVTDGATAGIIFFNNGTYLGMCGHGLIGVVRTLEYLGRVGPGLSRYDTPVGTVAAELSSNGSVTIENVPAYCHATDVAVDVPGIGRIVGDIDLSRARELTRVTQAIQDALRGAGITGAGGADIDHIELSVPPTRADADSRNFVLCSGGEYDRSPCGTGTSAVMAVKHHRGQLALGTPWRQESVAGSLFTGWLTAGPDGGLIPHVRGTAFVTGEATLRFDPNDPFRGGLGPA
jgi:4-hydroxyproline epimerase